MRTSSYGKNKKPEKQKPQGVKKVSDMKWLRFIRKLKPYNIQKGLRYLKHYGPKEFLIRLSERMEPEEVPYGPWREQYCAKEEDLARQKNHKFSYCPKISVVVPAYRTPEIFLRQMIESLEKQSYENWELVIGNASPEDETMARILKEYTGKDPRVKNVPIPENIGIAENTNAALAAAAGNFVGFMDHDDLLAPDALFEIAIRLEKDPSIDAFYTDEDKVRTDLSEYFQPHFKPDFNLDLLRANNYICHFCVIKKSLIEEMGGLRSEFDGAQDYDLVFRCVEKTITAHVPRILYHWRVHQVSTADNPISKTYAFEAGQRAIEAHLLRCGEHAEVLPELDRGFYRVRYKVQGNPKISILIPNKDHVKDLEKCLQSISKSIYKNYEITIIENNSKKAETFAYYDKIESDHIRILRWDGPFNYSAINNYAVSETDGEYLVLLNNDTEVIGKDWLGEMLANCQRKEVGIVGAKLYYPNGQVQHAGVIVGIRGIAGNMFRGLPKGYSGYLHKASTQQDLSAVTAACMMVKRSVYEEVGGFEEQLAVAFNDIDFCLKVRRCGYLVVYDPYVKLYHYESRSRGAEDNEEKIRRYQCEIDYVRRNWSEIMEKGDPMYNPNLTLVKCDYSLREKEDG